MPDKPPHDPRPAQPQGKTLLQYSPDGLRLVVAGLTNFVRTYNTGDEDNVVTVDNVPDETNAVVAGNDYFITGSEDGLVSQFNVLRKRLDKLLVRSSLPIRALVLSPDEKWLAVSSDEVIIKLVNRHDIEQIKIIREHPKIIKHLSYDPSGRYLAASCIDGIIYIYLMDKDEPTIFRTVDGIIRRLEVEDDATSECVWHPDGRAFACATATRDITTFSVADGAQQRSFTGGHMADVLSLAWSANGALLASTSRDGGLVLWETKTQSMIKRFDYEKTMNVTWHPRAENYLNWTTSLGEVYICPDFLRDEAHLRLLKGPRARSPFFHDSLDDTSAIADHRKPLVNGRPKPSRAGTPDSLDILLAGSDGEDWIDDDDGAGYTNLNGKRTNSHLGGVNGHVSKRGRQGHWSLHIHEPFQPGATPWHGNRKYLCLNLIGFVWTIDQDSHNTVTVEFYDRDMHRDFHFTDPYLYDKACLNEKGTLLACPSGDDHPAMVFYRPHETWTARADWRTQLPEGESVIAMALSENFVTVLTTKGYARVYTLFGTPYRIWRQKCSPVVTCAAFEDYVLTVGNGPVGAEGCSQLVYRIEDVRREEVCQSEDIVALPEGGTLKTVFFSDDGDPYIYDSTGTLLTLSHWRTPFQAKWTPLLDTTRLDRLASGRKEESYWPVAVAQGKFHCIILKGGDSYPYFPRPLLSEFEFKVPVSTVPPRATASKDEDEDEAEESNMAAGERLEESYVRSSILFSLLDDAVASRSPSHSQRSELARRELELDKVLLQLLAVECREGEERGMKALEIVRLMHDRSGKMMEAAGKVAGRWGRGVLEDKIRALGERRLLGLEWDGGKGGRDGDEKVDEGDI